MVTNYGTKQTTNISTCIRLTDRTNQWLFDFEQVWPDIVAWNKKKMDLQTIFSWLVNLGSMRQTGRHRAAPAVDS